MTVSTAAPPTAAVRAAHAWERRVHLAAHPLLYPFLRLSARRGPVVRVPGVGVMVNDAALARTVVSDTTTFSKAAKGSPADLWTPVLGPAVLLNMTGADHTTMRRKLSGLFTPGYVTRLCERSLSTGLADLTQRLVAGEAVDVVDAVQRCAGSVIAELVGLPPDSARDRETFRRGTEITGMVRLYRTSLTPRQIERAKGVMHDLTGPAVAAYESGDVTTVAGRMRELGLTRQEARGTVAAFVLTGTETLVSFVPRLIALASDTGWLGRMADEEGGPGLIDPVVNEAFRVTVPSPVMLRGTVAEGRIGDVAVHPGDRIVISTLACLQAYGPFDPTRPHPPEIRRLWFGAGEHFCLGMPLATAEVNAVLGAVLDAWRAAGPLTVLDRAPARKQLVPGYARLVVRAVGRT